MQRADDRGANIAHQETIAREDTVARPDYSAERIVALSGQNAKHPFVRRSVACSRDVARRHRHRRCKLWHGSGHHKVAAANCLREGMHRETSWCRHLQILNQHVCEVGCNERLLDVSSFICSVENACE